MSSFSSPTLKARLQLTEARRLLRASVEERQAAAHNRALATFTKSKLRIQERERVARESARESARQVEIERLELEIADLEAELMPAFVPIPTVAALPEYTESEASKSASAQAAGTHYRP
jgi:hypothetical protein